MLPDPLHPAVVHFPIVLSLLLPVVAGITLWTIHRGAKPARAWLVPVAFAAALAGSSWLAVESGEATEERVERVIAEDTIDGHAERGEQFLVLSVLVVALTGLGLMNHRIGAIARGASVVAAIGLVVAGYQVGRSGGALVYEHGAATAYTRTATGIAEPGPATSSGREDEDDRR